MTETHGYGNPAAFPQALTDKLKAKAETTVEPLEPTSEWEAGELPETYPWAV
jgi:hypothetical protein